MVCILRSYDEDYFKDIYHKKDHGKNFLECKEFDKKHDYDYKRDHGKRYDDDYERDYRRRYVLKDHDTKHDFDCECKKDHDRKHDYDCECKKDHGKKVVDFECDVVKPNIFNSTRLLRRNEEVVVASVSFEKLKKGAEVLLNGLIHAKDNIPGDDDEVIVRIRRVEGFPTGKLGTVIYQSPLLDLPVDTSSYLAIPILHCDDLCNHHCKEKHQMVTYHLTAEARNAQAGDGNVDLANAPITFAGTVFK